MNNRGRQGIPGREGHVGEGGIRGARGEQGPQGVPGPAHRLTWWEHVRPLLGYVILVVFLVASLAIFRYQEAKNLERLERESIERKEQVKMEVCNAIRETDKTLARAIEIAFRPRPNSTPSEDARRNALKKELLDSITRDTGCGPVDPRQ